MHVRVPRSGAWDMLSGSPNSEQAELAISLHATISHPEAQNMLPGLAPPLPVPFCTPLTQCLLESGADPNYIPHPTWILPVVSLLALRLAGLGHQPKKRPEQLNRGLTQVWLMT